MLGSVGWTGGFFKAPTLWLIIIIIIIVYYARSSTEQTLR